MISTEFLKLFIQNSIFKIVHTKFDYQNFNFLTGIFLVGKFLVSYFAKIQNLAQKSKSEKFDFKQKIAC